MELKCAALTRHPLQAWCKKEMTDHMRHVVEAGHELTPEEGQMLSVAYKNKAG